MNSQAAFHYSETTLCVLAAVWGIQVVSYLWRPNAAVADESHELEEPRIIYVDDDADGDGSSWVNARRHLQDALASARTMVIPVEIRVAQGVYRPDLGVGQVAGDLEATFFLIDAVALRGGYAGVLAADPDLRDPRRYETVLSGDLLGNDAVEDPLCDADQGRTRWDNCHHVVTGEGIGPATIVDGFTITGGNCTAIVDRGRLRACGPGVCLDAGSPALLNCRFEGNRTLSGDGAGLFCFHGSKPLVTGCTFIRNSAGFGGAISCSADSDATIANCLFSNNHGSWGGALCSQRSGPRVSGCVFSGNLAIRGGGAVCFFDGDHATIINCTFHRNDSEWQGGAIWSARGLLSSPNCIMNSVLWGNTPEEIFLADPSLLVGYCCVKGGWPGEGNIDVDPLFAEPGHWAILRDPVCEVEPAHANTLWIDGDYHLKSRAGRWDPNAQSWVQDDVTSPCVDAGDPNSSVGDELFPNGRRINMGAYGGTLEASKSLFDG